MAKGGPIFRTLYRAITVEPQYQGSSAERIRLQAQLEEEDAGDGIQRQKAEGTPQGILEIVVDNPKLEGAIAEGDEFYVDLTRKGRHRRAK